MRSEVAETAMARRRGAVSAKNCLAVLDVGEPDEVEGGREPVDDDRLRRPDQQHVGLLVAIMNSRGSIARLKFSPAFTPPAS